MPWHGRDAKKEPARVFKNVGLKSDTSIKKKHEQS